MTWCVAEHFYQFKTLFTESEASALIASHADGGEMAKALEDALEAEDDEDFEDGDTDEESDDEDDEGEEEEEDEEDDGSNVPWKVV